MTLLYHDMMMVIHNLKMANIALKLQSMLISANEDRAMIIRRGENEKVDTRI